MTFAVGENGSAPGQLPLEDVEAGLAMLHKALGEPRASLLAGALAGEDGPVVTTRDPEVMTVHRLNLSGGTAPLRFT